MSTTAIIVDSCALTSIRPAVARELWAWRAQLQDNRVKRAAQLARNDAYVETQQKKNRWRSHVHDRAYSRLVTLRKRVRMRAPWRISLLAEIEAALSRHDLYGSAWARLDAWFPFPMIPSRVTTWNNPTPPVHLADARQLLRDAARYPMRFTYAVPMDLWLHYTGHAAQASDGTTREHTTIPRVGG